MNNDFSSARVFTHMQGLSQLKLAAKNNEEASLQETAKQFESLFIQMMLKSMRDASLQSDLFGSDQMQFHMDMFDKQLSLELGARKSLGIAEMLVRQLGRDQDKPSSASPFSEMIQPLRSEQPATSIREKADQSDSFAGPLEFIERLRPLAEQTAEKLGVNAEALIAQAALETGWGQKIIHDTNGNSSHNLFGIKAHSDWQGHRVSVNTLEFEDGTMEKTRAEFRAYDSYAESFDDYARFLQSNPRYQSALDETENSEAYISALQTAGYATDPQYAEKIIDIMRRYEIQGGG